MKEITLEEALKLVSFEYDEKKGWQVGSVAGSVFGDVNGDVRGYVKGNVDSDIFGNVRGTINGREWKFVETPKDKLQRLITESGNQELIDTFNQLEDN